MTAEPPVYGDPMSNAESSPEAVMEFLTVCNGTQWTRLGSALAWRTKRWFYVTVLVTPPK